MLIAACVSLHRYFLSYVVVIIILKWQHYKITTDFIFVDKNTRANLVVFTASLLMLSDVVIISKCPVYLLIFEVYFQVLVKQSQIAKL